MDYTTSKGVQFWSSFFILHVYFISLQDLYKVGNKWQDDRKEEGKIQEIGNKRQVDKVGNCANG